MTDKKTYLVSDLAAELGVPRTTVNDWLKRYDRYLPSEMSGRRRTYTQAALEVLQSVNKMRNDGLSAGKIETELEKNFAIRPEEVIENKEELKVEAEKPAVEEKVSAPADNSSDELALPQLRREEFDRFIGTFEEFSRIEKSRKRGALYVWIVILMISLFSVLTAWYMARLVKLQAVNNQKLIGIQQENAAAREAQVAANNDGKKAIAKQNKELSELRRDMILAEKKQQENRELERQNSKKAMAEMQKLIMSVQEEQKSFRQKLESRYEKEIRAKDQAVKQQQNLKNAADKKLKAKEKEFEMLKKEADKLRRELEEMKKIISEKEKNAVSAAETKAAETALPAEEKTQK